MVFSPTGTGFTMASLAHLLDTLGHDPVTGLHQPLNHILLPDLFADGYGPEADLVVFADNRDQIAALHSATAAAAPASVLSRDQNARTRTNMPGKSRPCGFGNSPTIVIVPVLTSTWLFANRSDLSTDRLSRTPGSTPATALDRRRLLPPEFLPLGQRAS